MRFVQNPDISLHELEGEIVLYQGAERKVHVLNSTAGFIWRECETPSSAEELAERIVEAYDVAAEAANHDVGALLEVLCERGLVRPEGE